MRQRPEEPAAFGLRDTYQSHISKYGARIVVYSLELWSETSRLCGPWVVGRPNSTKSLLMGRNMARTAVHV